MKLVLFLPLLCAANAAALPACNRPAPSEAEPPKAVAVDAGPKTLAELMGVSSEKPPPPPPPTDADFVKLGSREPGWDLDATDPARDYVERYIVATQRYGKEAACVHAQPSKAEGGRTIVEARDSDQNGCTGTRAVRDTFAVDVAKNRLALADPAVGRPLGDWPDGSGAETMPGPEPKEGPSMEAWNTVLRKALKTLDLVPLRVQFYGRGSYPVITVAGWYGVVAPGSAPAQLTDVAKKICVASKQLPLGILASNDRSKVLRVRCPDAAAWETL
jgi:hypothetical protein